MEGARWRCLLAASIEARCQRALREAQHSTPDPRQACPLPPPQASTELGCGFAQCGGLGGLVVCFYNPPGNVAGQYSANVGQA